MNVFVCPGNDILSKSAILFARLSKNKMKSIACSCTSHSEKNETSSKNWKTVSMHGNLQIELYFMIFYDSFFFSKFTFFNWLSYFSMFASDFDSCLQEISHFKFKVKKKMWRKIDRIFHIYFRNEPQQHKIRTTRTETNYKRKCNHATNLSQSKTILSLFYESFIIISTEIWNYVCVYDDKGDGSLKQNLFRLFEK